MEQEAALSLLRRGAMTVPEVAAFAGVSVQLVRAWCKADGLDWKRVRQARNTREWERARDIAEHCPRPFNYRRLRASTRMSAQEKERIRRRAEENPQW